MRIQFTAQELFFENDGDVAYANLMGGDGDEPEHFLIFQRGLMDDDQAIHWNQPDYLKASNTDMGDYFGISVAVSDEIIVVGAYSEDSNATGVNGNQTNNSAGNAGAVYTFVAVNTVYLPLLTQ